MFKSKYKNTVFTYSISYCKFLKVTKRLILKL